MCREDLTLFNPFSDVSGFGPVSERLHVCALGLFVQVALLIVKHLAESVPMETVKI